MLTLTAMAVSVALVAQTDDSSGDYRAAAALDEIVVTASRTATPASAIPGTVTLIARGEIAQQSLLRDELSSVLEFSVPGFAPSTRKLAGRAESLRGRNPLYLIDGVPQHNALRDGQRDGYLIDLDFVERVEVINGSNAIQGVGATGGVVQLVTRQPGTQERWETTLNTRFNADDGFDSDSFSYKLSAVTGRRFESIDLVMGVAYQERGLFFDGNGDPVGLYPTQGDIMDSSSLGLFFKSNWRISEHSSLELMVNDYDLSRNGDFRSVSGDRDLGILTGTQLGDPSALVGDPASNEVTTASLTWRQQNLGGGELVAQIFDQSFQALFEGGTFGGFFRLTPDGEAFLDQSAVVSDKNGLKLTWNRPNKSQRGNLTLGLDVYRDESAQLLARSGRQWVPETRFETVAPFIQGSFELTESLTLSGGVRYEDAKLQVDDYTTIASADSTFVRGGSPEFSQSLPNLGLVWRLGESWVAYASYAEGFTMPDVGRVLRGVATPGADVETLLAVEPIVTNNREVGLEWNTGPLRARIGLFDSQADNGSRLRLNTVGIFEVERQRTEIDGVELSVDYAWSNGWQLGGNYSRTNGRFDSDGDNRVDSDLDGLNIGPNRLNLYLQGEVAEDWSLRLQGSLLRGRTFEGSGAPANADFDGYSLLDAMVAWDSPIGQLSFGVENLFDRQYVTYFSQVETGQRDDTFFAGAGRSLAIGWQVTL